LHPPESRAAAAALTLASQVDPTLSAAIKVGEARQITRSLDAPIRQDTKVDIFLEADDLTSQKRSENHLVLTWKGEPVGGEFVLKMRRLSCRRTFFPILRIFADGAPIGRIRVKISRVRLRASDLRPGAEHLRPYRQASLSYSSADRTEVLKRAQSLRAAGIKVFQDVLSLDPGDRWRRKIFKYIDETDLFLLCWSRAARDSVWVLKETRYALRRQRKSGSPDVVPVILEGPPPITPPRWLSHLHFNDPICYFLAAGYIEKR
jgi:hypothetical protein